MWKARWRRAIPSFSSLTQKLGHLPREHESQVLDPPSEGLAALSPASQQSVVTVTPQARHCSRPSPCPALKLACQATKEGRCVVLGGAQTRWRVSQQDECCPERVGVSVFYLGPMLEQKLAQCCLSILSSDHKLQGVLGQLQGKGWRAHWPDERTWNVALLLFGQVR